MHGTYTSLAGNKTRIDLDAVVVIVSGPSGRHLGWSALVVYEATKQIFIELRDSPQDIRGNSGSEAEEVDAHYLQKHFELGVADIARIKMKPNQWRHIKIGKHRNA